MRAAMPRKWAPLITLRSGSIALRTVTSLQPDISIDRQERLCSAETVGWRQTRYQLPRTSARDPDTRAAALKSARAAFIPPRVDQNGFTSVAGSIDTPTTTVGLRISGNVRVHWKRPGSFQFFPCAAARRCPSINAPLLCSQRKQISRGTRSHSQPSLRLPPCTSKRRVRCQGMVALNRPGESRVRGS